MINPQILKHHHMTTATTTALFTLNHHTTTALFTRNHHSLTLNPRFYPGINPILLSTTVPRQTKHLTLCLSAINSAAFPSPNFPKLGLGLGLSFFLSLSSVNPSPQSPLNSQPSDGKYFTWHKPPTNTPTGVGISDAGGSNVAAVVLGWLGATQKHLRRYAEMYTSRGIEAITFVVPVIDVMKADLGKTVENRIEILAKEIVSWLSNGDRRLVFHTFSTTGWLVYGSILAYMQGKPDLIEKIKGCIVDSGGDPELNPKIWAAGFGAALLKKRNTRVSLLAEARPATDDDINKPQLQEEESDILEAAVLFVLEIMFTFVFKLPVINQKLSKIISLLTENQPPCPQLYLYSTADKVIRYQTVESFIEQQKMRGRNVQSFNFGSSPHVDHYRTFPDVYTSQVNSFINDVLVLDKLA